MNWKYKYIGMALLATCVICSCSEDDDNPSFMGCSSQYGGCCRRGSVLLC